VKVVEIKTRLWLYILHMIYMCISPVEYMRIASLSSDNRIPLHSVEFVLVCSKYIYQYIHIVRIVFVYIRFLHLLPLS